MGSVFRHRWDVKLTSLSASALLLFACGSSGSQSGAQVTIGVEGPMTGQYAEVGTGYWEGAQAAAAEINAGGGINGGKLVLDQADDVADPADAVPAINKMINIDHIAALELASSVVLPAISPIVTQHQIVTMFQGGTSSFDTNTDPWIWRPSPSDSQLGVAMAAYAIDKGYKKAAMMFSSAASAQTLGGVVTSTFTKNGGTIVANETIQPGATSYRSEVAAVVAANPDVIFTQVDPPTAAPLFTNFKQMNNLAIPFIGSDLTAGADFIKAITPAVAHSVLTSIQGSTSAGPGAAPFLQYFNQVYPGQQPPSGANYGYDSIMEISLAIEKAGGTDPNKIDAAVPQVNNPPGQDVSDWATAVAAIKAGTKIHFVGAGGPAGYDSYHNSVGSFDAFQSDSSGNLTVAFSISVTDMQKAAAGTLGS